MKNKNIIKALVVVLIVIAIIFCVYKIVNKNKMKNELAKVQEYNYFILKQNNLTRSNR